MDAFEQEIADYVGASASAAISSGTAALHLSAILAGVKEDDIVLFLDIVPITKWHSFWGAVLFTKK